MDTTKGPEPRPWCCLQMVNLLSYRWGSIAKTTDTPMSGSAVKSHDWLKFRTSCRSRLTRQFWKQFVFNNTTTWIIKFIFKSSLRAKWRTGIQETGACPRNPKPKKKEGWQEKIQRPLGRSSWLVDGVQRTSGGRIACACTKFSRIRSGTSYESGNDIKEAQYLYSHPETEIATSVWGLKWQGLLADDALAKLHHLEKTLVTW